jgi:hypothetical protein
MGPRRAGRVGDERHHSWPVLIGMPLIDRFWLGSNGLRIHSYRKNDFFSLS